MATPRVLNVCSWRRLLPLHRALLGTQSAAVGFLLRFFPPESSPDLWEYAVITVLEMIAWPVVWVCVGVGGGG